MREIEERLAHLERANDDLSGEVARQARAIARLERRVQMLMEREAEREAGGQMSPVDRPPPHY
ncbi:SlyX family protein [Pseudoroseicyclus sp. CXY001]|uniref:SlyX family protein n=1 Tax=Pseudoroseicyclus sp. CXY001 TaxID=3242492 RepID=UPI00358DB679